MKYTLKRDTDELVEIKEQWQIKNITLKGQELTEFLSCQLVNVMEGILDPDTAGKSPDRYIINLQSGRLGDFSKRYIISAYDREKLIGLLIGLPEEEGDLHIYTLGILPEYRKMGVGTALLTRCINDMKQIDKDNVILDVHSDNIPAYNLYKKLGFYEFSN